MSKIYLSVLLMLLSLYGTGQEVQNSEKVLLDSIRHYAEKANIPGLSLAEIENFSISNIFSIGVQNLENQYPVDNQTVFEAASLTKPIVAYCALKLVENETLNLDKPLSDYFIYPILHDEKANEITARMVLSHTSGLPNWRSHKDSIHLKFNPGSAFGYSGEGFVYLQKVMEKLTHKNLDSIVHQFVFEPLEMKNSSLTFDSLPN